MSDSTVKKANYGLRVEGNSKGWMLAMSGHCFAFCARLLSCLLVPFIVVEVAGAEVDAPVRQWALEELKEVLRHRLDVIDTMDVEITKVATSGKGYRDYLKAQHRSNVAFGQYFGIKRNFPKPESFDVDLVSRTGLRWQYHTGGEEKYTIRAFKDGKEAGIAIYCNIGDVWQMYLPGVEEGKPQVVIDEKPYRGLEPIRCWLGTHGPLWTLIDNYSSLREPLRPLAETLQEKADGVVQPAIKSWQDEERGELVSLTYYPIANIFPKGPTPVLVQARIDFSPKYGMAPIRMQTTELFRQGTDLQEIATPRTAEIVWSDFSEVVSGVWLPGRIQLDQYSSVALPKDEAGVRPPPHFEGAAILGANRPIDSSSVLTGKYLVKSTVVTVDRPILANEMAERPKCDMEFASGTVVLDRTKSELFQLTGVSPAVGATLKLTLEKAQQIVPPPKNKNSNFLIWSINGGMAVILLVTFAWRRSFRAQRRN